LPRADQVDAGRSLNFFMRKIIPIIVLLAGCTEMPTLPSLPSVTPYKIDIQQGNYVTQDMVDKLKSGMTRAQVRFVLGTPLVVDAFHTDRWDYVYTYQKAGGVTEHRRLAVIFKDDKLARLEGDVMPAKPKPTTDAVGADKPKPVAAEPKREAGAPAKAQAAKPEAVAPATAAPGSQGSVLTTTSGQPVQTGPQTAQPAKAESGAENPKQNEPQEEKGFFGRMLEKLGF
jgi:outer membrane protein assembly factor BamE